MSRKNRRKKVMVFKPSSHCFKDVARCAPSAWPRPASWPAAARTRRYAFGTWRREGRSGRWWAMRTRCRVWASWRMASWSRGRLTKMCACGSGRVVSVWGLGSRMVRILTILRRWLLCLMTWLLRGLGIRLWSDGDVFEFFVSINQRNFFFLGFFFFRNFFFFWVFFL